MDSPAAESGAQRVRSLTAAHRHAEAYAAARALIAAGAADREALYLAALNLRLLDRLDESLALLEDFAHQHPGFSRIHQERAHCLLRLGQVEAAIASFERAVVMNGTLHDSWQQLARLCALRGEFARSAQASSQLTYLAAQPPTLVLAASLFADGDLERAESLVRGHGREGALDAMALPLLARIRHARGALCDAQALFAEALEISPEDRTLRLDYVRLLLERGRYAAARAQLEQLQRDGGAPDEALLHAAALAGLADYGAAITLLQAANQRQPSAAAAFMLGDCLRATGQSEAAIESYRWAAGQGAYAEACWSLANLKTYRFNATEVQQMQRAVDVVAGAASERESLQFALGSALSASGAFAPAWRCFQEANALHRVRRPYRVEWHERLVADLIEVCDGAFFESRAGWGVRSGEPLFLVGLPRSGSTLLQQMLACHPQIGAAGELGELPALVQDLEGRRPPPECSAYPERLRDLGPQRAQALGQHYLEALQPYRHGRPMCIDKLPNNFLHVGLIQLLLPTARIIDVRREPRDCCLSNFMQRFASGQEFSYDLDDLARFYRLYVRLMQHWDQVLPGRVLRVHYEDLVQQPEAQLRRILAHCGLEFEARCLQFSESRNAVSTASSEQVRRPLSREGIGASCRYAASLAPLEDALGDALKSYRASPV